MPVDDATLGKMAQKLRRHSLESTAEAGSGHPTTCMSCAEIMSVLFFDEMRWDPLDPSGRDQDVFVLSKGHAAPILWAALKEAGAITDDLLSLRRYDSPLEGHPTFRSPWVRVATGSLGQGLCAAAGMAVARRRDGTGGRVYALLGDGEAAEGSVWEAAEFASFQGLENLCAILDVNRLGQSGPTMYQHDTAVYEARLRAFGWDAVTVDGHDVAALRRAFALGRQGTGKPLGIVARTFKGQGVSPLAVEDLTTIGQRPKVDFYPASEEFQARLFLVMRMVMFDAQGKLRTEQISLFAGHKTVLTFQETSGDVWDPIRQHIAKAGSRIRENDASFLVYSLVDAVVDHCFPILEDMGERLEDLERRILENPTPDSLRDIYRLKRELLTLRRAVWPMREVVHQLQGETNECFSETSRTYMRDVYDHVVQIIDVIEAYRETALGLSETYMTVIGNRMNQIMKVLTIIGTIFIPLTFLAGVYGMNFKYLPELEMKWAYPAFWVICFVVAGGMIAWFRHRKWL